MQNPCSGISYIDHLERIFTLRVTAYSVPGRGSRMRHLIWECAGHISSRKTFSLRIADRLTVVDVIHSVVGCGKLLFGFAKITGF